MTIGIKSRNFSPTKTENTFEKSGFGWAPGQEKKFEGMGINQARYAKNYQNAAGICKTCLNVDKSKLNTCTGEHCKLRLCDK